jgi:hypothetical protein
VRSDLGDAGEMLDATAKAAYKAGLEDLQAELDEAESFNDPARAVKAKDEIDFLASELARAVGLGGRDRRAASHAERARLNVTRAIRAAMGNLARANPARRNTAVASDVIKSAKRFVSGPPLVTRSSSGRRPRSLRGRQNQKPAAAGTRAPPG